MTLGWTCSRCGTRYGAIVRHGKSDLRRWLFARCRAGKCPTTLRALLWRILCWRERRMLRSDDAYLARLRDRSE